jgi:hypothetical protein
MIVPFAKGPMQAQPQQPMPSEANLLMALAEMHKQGKFAKPKPEPTPPPEAA